MAINSKRKGARGERELSKVLRDYGFKDARRTQQYCGAGEDSADCVGLPGIHIECKRVEKLNISNAMWQAEKDAKNGNIPTVFHRKDNENWLVTMKLCDWVNIYGEYHSGVLMAKGCE